MYIYIDGDDIGLKIERCFMENDEIGLRTVNDEISKLIENFTKLITDLGIAIIFSGADGIICRCLENLLPQVNEIVRSNCGSYTFSIGASPTLQGAFLSLRYAKSLHKNITIVENGKGDFLIHG